MKNNKIVKNTDVYGRKISREYNKENTLIKYTKYQNDGKLIAFITEFDKDTNELTKRSNY
ncbi:MAG: DUF2963 domain-containing protein [Lettuce witches'-broom phytoplasma]